MEALVFLIFVIVTLGVTTEYKLRKGIIHDYNTDPLEGPSGSCRIGCIKCKEISPITGRKLTKLEKALK